MYKKYFTYFKTCPAWFYDEFDEFFESMQEKWFWELRLDLQFAVTDEKILNVNCKLEDGEAYFEIEDNNYVIHNAGKVNVDCESALICEIEERIYHPENFIN